MAEKYYVNQSKTDIINAYGTSHNDIDTSLLFDMSSYGFNGESTRFIEAGKLTSITGWGRSPDIKPYINVPFATKSSCPVPSLKTQGDTYIAVNGTYWTSPSSTYYLRYNSTSGACQVSINGASYSTIGSGYTGIFVGLQGAGGGGGGSGFDNGVAAASCKGGGGGGGGAFIWAYLDLSAIPNGVVTVQVGQGGAAGENHESWAEFELDAETGKGGTATTLTYDGTRFLYAGGGGGGEGAALGSAGVSGGAGGITEIKDASWITVLNYYYGKSGGSSGSLKQYYVGITGSANPGKDGGSFLPTDTLWIPCCSSSPLVYRNGSPWSDKYASGSGGNSYEHSDSAYLSGGGGGGASVMSQAATESSSMFGYGAGGKGGSATTGSTSKGDAGRDGCLFIAS